MGAAEWFVTSVSSLVGLQDTLLCECFVTIAARESCGMSLHGCTAECEISTKMNILIFTAFLLSVLMNNRILNYRIVVQV